jgi:hypothetical protein
MAAQDGYYLADLDSFDEDEVYRSADGWYLGDIVEQLDEDYTAAFNDGWYLLDVTESYDEDFTFGPKDGWYLLDVAESYDEDLSYGPKDGWYLTDVVSQYDEEAVYGPKDGTVLLGGEFDEDFVQSDFTFWPPGRTEPLINVLPGIGFQIDAGLQVLLDGKFVSTNTFTIAQIGYHEIVVRRKVHLASPPLPPPPVRYRVAVIDPAILKTSIRNLVRDTEVESLPRLSRRLSTLYVTGTPVDESAQTQLEVQSNQAIALAVEVDQSSGFVQAGEVAAAAPGFWRSSRMSLHGGLNKMRLTYSIVTGPIVIGLDPPSVGTFATTQSLVELPLVPPNA